MGAGPRKWRVVLGGDAELGIRVHYRWVCYGIPGLLLLRKKCDFLEKREAESSFFFGGGTIFIPSHTGCREAFVPYKIFFLSFFFLYSFPPFSDVGAKRGWRVEIGRRGGQGWFFTKNKKCRNANFLEHMEGYRKMQERIHTSLFLYISFRFRFGFRVIRTHDSRAVTTAHNCALSASPNFPPPHTYPFLHFP